jgi:hypothetical protein
VEATTAVHEGVECPGLPAEVLVYRQMRGRHSLYIQRLFVSRQPLLLQKDTSLPVKASPRQVRFHQLPRLLPLLLNTWRLLSRERGGNGGEGSTEVVGHVEESREVSERRGGR